MSRIALIVGSLRRESFNRQVAEAMVRLPAAHGQEFVWPEIGDLPLYNQDHEPNPPAEYVRLKDEIRGVDGVFFVTPEYNRSIPGVLKNALDAASRPYGESAWAGKPAGIVSVSAGKPGAAMAQQHLRNVLAYLDMPTLGQPEAFVQWTDALLTPVAAGEDLYLWEGFREAIETRAFDIIHPDMLSSGGLSETKRIADHAERFGIPTALHACCSPVGFMANVHLGASIASLIAVEHHGLDLPFFRDLVRGMDADYMADGYVTVPDAPGLGIDLNEEVIRENLRKKAAYFNDTSEWNDLRVGADFRGHEDD